MYVPAQFEQRDLAEMHKMMRAHPLATWIVRDEQEMIVNHVPFLLDATQGEFGTLRGHVARANPVWQRAGSGESKVIFHGPQSYISPGWYPSKRETGRVVPTWNYIVVHADGMARAIDDRMSLLEHVSQLSDTHESHRAEPWHVSDAPADYIDRLLNNIVGIEIPIRTLHGKWKISQHRPLHETAAVIDALRKSQSNAMADVMQMALDGARSRS